MRRASSVAGSLGHQAPNDTECSRQGHSVPNIGHASSANPTVIAPDVADVAYPGSGFTGAVCSSELLTRDTATAVQFYAEDLWWTAETSDIGGTSYTAAKLGEDRAAGMLMMPDAVPAAAPAHPSV